MMTNTKRAALDKLTALHTAFDSFADFVSSEYTPTLRERDSRGQVRPSVRRLANAFDRARKAQGRSGSWRPARLSKAQQRRVERAWAREQLAAAM